MSAWIRTAFTVFFILTITGQVFAGEYRMPPPGEDIVGENYVITVKRGDSLTSIRQNHGVSYWELLEANPQIDFYRLKVGQEVIIAKRFILPHPRKGIVINVAELRLYYFSSDGATVQTFPVGLGRKDWRTPLASATVVNKQEDPVWTVPDDIRAYVYNKTGKWLDDKIYPGPDNPLGKYALYLSKQGYLIHGTNSPTSVGTFISSGCMRLLNKPIETLYEEVQVGTPVHIIHYPNKAGWSDNKLYLESHLPVQGYSTQPISSLNKLSAESMIYEATYMRPARINWNLVPKIINEHTGIPQQIGYRYYAIY